MRKTYPTDLSDAEWTRLRSFLPTPNAQGRPRTHSLRDVLDAISLRLEKWLSLAALAPSLPSLVCRLLPFQEIPTERVVVPHPQSCARSSEEEGGQGSPTDRAAIMDSQSVKTTEESAHPSGYDAHKNIKGRKRHLL
jgi:putative transposase